MSVSSLDFFEHQTYTSTLFLFPHVNKVDISHLTCLKPLKPNSCFLSPSLFVLHLCLPCSLNGAIIYPAVQGSKPGIPLFCPLPPSSSPVILNFTLRCPAPPSLLSLFDPGHHHISAGHGGSLLAGLGLWLVTLSSPFPARQIK